MSVTIFTDGASRGNPGPGGWAAIVVDGTNVCELGGGEKTATNNRMELTAAAAGLSKAPKKEPATVYTDSSYVIHGITKWIHNWKRNDWQTKTKKDVLNKELWMELADEIEKRTVKWEYVSGHAGILGNERCDHIATAFADGRKVKLYKGPLAQYDLPNILDIKAETQKLSAKKSASSRAKAKPYSYVSSVGGVIEVHPTWAECEKRVKGVKGARFKKAISAEDEADITDEFGAL
ncbi:MAG: ribonuclease [Candidatus Parcubacteria bacterium]|jgi:ribonuclease HI|nr:ribonuclease [Candidatus Parcubacteria bacterium]